MAVSSLAPNQDNDKNKKDLIDSLRDKNISILVVDDNQLNVKLLNRQLQLLGCGVDSANSGFAGLELWDLNNYNIVFTDCNMPRMDGEQFIRFLTATPKYDPAVTHLIAISADHSIPEHNKFVDAGAKCLHYKPLDLVKLHRIICACLGLRSSEKSPKPNDDMPAWPVGQVVNGDYLTGVMGGDLHLQHTQYYLAELFLKQAPEILTELRIAVRVSRYQDLAHLAHKFKSSALSVGADRVAATCVELEKFIQVKNCTQIDATIDEIEIQLGDVKQYWAADIMPAG